MKICYCLPDTCLSGGIERVVTSQACHMASHGADVVLITTEQRGRKPFYPLEPAIRSIDLGINYLDIHDAPFLKKLSARASLKKLHRRRLQEVLRHERPDITVSAFQGEEDFLYKLPEAGRTVGVFHFSHDYRILSAPPGLQRLAARWLTRTTSRLASRYDAFVCLTHEDAADWGSLANLHVIPHFSTIPAADAPAPAESKRVISVGRLAPQKGYDLLIEAWRSVYAKHPDWHLDIFGEGPMREQLQGLIDEAKMHDAVTLHGTVKDIAERYAQAAFYVCSSRYEGFCMALLETMAAGLAAVSFRCKCGPSDLIADGGSGILVDTGDTDALAYGICRLIEDPSLRHGMAGKALDRSAEFGIDYIMARWAKLFKSLMP